MAEARFDDLTPGGVSFRFVGHSTTIQAHTPSEVIPALEAVEHATSEGRWAAGYLSYEAAPGLDADLAVRGRPPNDPRAGLPLVWFGVFEGREEIDPPRASGSSSTETRLSWDPSIPRDEYEASIGRIRRYIADGETYQVNYSMRLRSSLPAEHGRFYEDLCLAQRGPHAAYLDTGRYRILSASPELFFRIDGEEITTRPMKGTTPRGRWPGEDAAAASYLLGSPKERAENAMIVDLLRNDLGRISMPGSVEVTEMFTTERYETVWQLTSTISSRLVPGTRVLDALRALFPCGSVTGAPKVRSMQIIAELEDSPRGVYTGSIGYMAPAGSPAPRAEFNVAIRTVVVDEETGTAEYGVGGGVTHDSSARGEYAECLTKARVLTARRPAFELLETILHEPGSGFLWLSEHLERLTASAEYFGYPFDEARAREALESALVGGEGPARVRLTLTRSGSISAQAGPAPGLPAGPLRLAIDDEPVDSGDALLFHKTTRREPYRRRAARHPEADDVLLVNERGEVTESTIANVAVLLDGRWWTPPLDAGCLPGVGRARFLADGTLAERTISVREARSAGELALVSSVRRWRAAELIGG